MMRQYELVDRVRRYNPHADEVLLNRAYVYAMKAHGAQVRASGDPYFSHPLEVAAILTDLQARRCDDRRGGAARRHRGHQVRPARRSIVMFGREIGATRRRADQAEAPRPRLEASASQAENFRKLLLAIAADVRVLLVKLADRLHNMRTLHFVPPETSGRGSPRRPSTSTRLWRGAWACSACATNSRIWRFGT